jgi:DNA replication protein DnaC
MNYVKDCDSKWFFIGGQVGSGKSHLCIGISLELLKQGKTVKLMSWRDSTVQLKAIIMEAESYAQEINIFKKAEILCIDDFFKTVLDKNPTDADINIASEIIDYRYRNGLATIINSEKNIDDLLEISESVGSRILQQSIGYYIDIPNDPSKNYRLKECGQYD